MESVFFVRSEFMIDCYFFLFLNSRFCIARYQVLGWKACFCRIVNIVFSELKFPNLRKLCGLMVTWIDGTFIYLFIYV